MNEKSNIGVTGIESIRIGGATINNLPIAETAIVNQQMPEVIETDRQNKINAVKEKYPKQSISWLDGAVNECEATIKNVQRLISEQSVMINEYSGYISLCDHRDRMIAKIEEKGGDASEIKEQIKELKIQFPPYDVNAMKQQIVQCNEAIERSNDVISQEHESISKLRELKSKCIKRDIELKSLGV